MPRRASFPIRLTVLDRLIRPRDLPAGIPWPPEEPGESLRRLRESVARDVGWLLNTVSTPNHVPPELRRTIAAYGLSDISSLTIPGDEAQLVPLLTAAIEAFEPRLMRGFRVTPVPSVNGPLRTLSFLIEGTLSIEPAPAPVAFTTELFMTVGQNGIEGSPHE